MNRRKKLTIYSMLCSSFVVSACQTPPSAETDREVIRIGHLPITHAAPLYFLDANQDDYFEGGAEVELVRFSSWIELMDALNAGRIDGASVLFELAMKAKERGIGLHAAALGHREGNAVITGNEIDDPAELKGESVAIPHTLSAHHLLLDEMLERAGVPYDAVDVVEMPPAEMPAALGEGQVASYIVAEPFGALGVQNGVGEVEYQSQDFCPDNCLCCALVLRDDFADANPEFTDKFVKSYSAAGKEAGDPTEQAIETHQAYLDVDDNVLEQSLGWISYDDLRIREAEYDYLQNKLTEMDLIDEPPDYSEFVNDEIVRDMDGESR
ncbi:ABC transporter substrate-binding protein [Salisediminibacterium halotolerans]|uniref:ABC transporter substrate-binding protein n=1 Tax=Salisediminibacterium halotolerans TaxID=517425 RepID=UPI000EB41836|nr:ABC transporter substrate-binding protein [Salisediminibacterium halotolerans]RLJ75651.1 NitT/TauT family transport system substrate-binding protein [Actinophytocola xinjiangensis]RPE89505.1 NitT/TauT family transport system substrate-binding protein [Salisediminibacterium halotolerans]TWG36264.1 NitT/TauT family transport system substrate-binding protein [Salisediminibacterium halotolerans]GEL07390.1 hypothetical protein SHA02_08060 [Salisediminibacterium halotolerans]